AKLVILSAEAICRVMLLEAVHTSDVPLDPAMVLLKSIIRRDTAAAEAALGEHGAAFSLWCHRIITGRLGHSMVDCAAASPLPNRGGMCRTEPWPPPSSEPNGGGPSSGCYPSSLHKTPTDRG